MPGIHSSKCVLVTGATSGIGRALALAISALPSKPQVIAAGRRQGRLTELADKGLQTMFLDLSQSHDTLRTEIKNLLTKYPDLDTVVLCAGIQHEFDFKKANDVDISNVVSEMNINYTSIVATVAAIIPHFQKLAPQERECNIIGISSGFAILPGAWVPNYSASKAALRSFLMSLRAQFEGTNINVIEVLPPLVESELHDLYGTTEKLSKSWMPLNEFIPATLDSLACGDAEITVGDLCKSVFQRFEAGKMQMALRLMQDHGKET